MAAVANPPTPMSAMRRESAVMDTRTPSPVHSTQSAETTNNPDPAYKPDLSAEVALLSTKLVNAINYQTNLDDSLQQARHDLEQARQRVAQLEAENQRHSLLVSTGALVKAVDVNKTISKLRHELSTERAMRSEAEKGKKQVESELENLTTALFEEANGMVAAARKDTEAVEKRNAQLRSQLQEYELLMAAQQEQLSDLKGSMEKLESDQPATRDPSVPSTPITAQHAMFEALQISPSVQSMADMSPEHPLHFSTLINPVLRNDTKAFEDFQDLLLLARRMGAHSRSNSSQANAANSSQVYGSSGAIQSSPNLPGSFNLNPSSPTSAYSGASASIPPLKDSRFYKRVLTEDIEPTLRLDLAPGLSFLSRRTVLASLLAGTLAVEPYPQNKHYFACTLCGESKRQEQYVRRHRFRTSEEDNVSKPLCDFCVARLRATCDFVGFLRMVRDGHWKCDGEDDQKSAWEESVRLRERMFWARLGGGVVPCFPPLQRSGLPSPSSANGFGSGRQSLENIPEGEAKDTSAKTEGDVFQEKSAPPSVRVSTTAITSTNAKLADHEVQDNDFGQGKPVDTQAHDGAESSAPPTPFEDANEEPEKPFTPPAQTDSPDQPAIEEGAHPAPDASSLQPPRDQSPARASLDVDQEPRHERKNSSVLARVKAMEAGKS
ncbi:Putative GDP/GTP exchange factor Sec2, guanine nucleotide exchange factor RAB3IL/RAB3IP/Sec2 [Septoria linicola]|uniref:GDP/GTP exchange factor Sec2, guanine nucleotide exchange factor RAB3IL/RAB3IP/Sec2 n=1 Tax=Septoria linicola TaxID=215465 RepID=A0A9Q9AJJ0_9PEZI|nr:putative GDP/GTP exchange factor Sec2, guanine nucleotide exchange factor RAB3IL/RAB3IP/Sec2 [Septoria linicola]USW50509.1 Putative GDP/GTP exchange factor Sec2, guanine nucleotide exchange factor RAB3IL/RAB3IP/Sec2 [Septoria linicola]